MTSPDTRLDSCRFCGRLSEREDSISGGWIPYFYRREDGFGEWVSVDQATCVSCTAEHLRYNDLDGEWELKEGHVLPDTVN